MSGTSPAEERTRIAAEETASARRGAPSLRGDRESSPALTVIVPVTERPADLPELYRAYSAPIRDEGWSFEFVFAFEPYYRDRAERLADAFDDREPVRVLVAGQTVGEASLVRRAADRGRGDLIVTLPAYYRVQPETLPRLVRRVADGEVDLALARRRPRRDAWINRLQSRAFHALLSGISGTDLDDLGCGVRAMRREILDDVPLYGDFFRFFPVLALNQGYRVEELDGEQHPRDRQPRVYSPGTYLRRLIDLLGVFFLVRFTYKPLRFFGLVGSGVSAAGGAILLVLFVQRMGGQGIADRPMLLLGVLLLTLGVQAVALGLIGEIIVHLNAPDRPGYRVLEVFEGEE